MVRLLSYGAVHSNTVCQNLKCLTVPNLDPSGQAVERSQVIGGVTFFYQPPPRHAVPFAAALRADSEGGGSTMPGWVESCFFAKGGQF